VSSSLVRLSQELTSRYGDGDVGEAEGYGLLISIREKAEVVKN
jgi:hypothetical protein